MKSAFIGLIIGVASISSALAQGSHGEGGGGVVYCKHKSGAELYDYVEAREAPYNLKIKRHPKSLGYLAIAEEMIQHYFWFSPYRQALYGSWLQSFEKERTFLSEFSPRPVPDSERISLPKDCRYVQAVIQQVPEFKDQFRYYVNEKAWNDLVDDENRAGLVVHELLYREAMTYGHDTSAYLRNIHRTFRDWIYGVNRMDAGSRGDGISVLMESHFPVSDIPVFGPYYKTRIVDVSNFEKKYIDVKDIFLIQFGECLDETCTKFRENLKYGQYASLDTTATKNWWPLSNRMDRLLLDQNPGEGRGYLSFDSNVSYEVRTDYDNFGSTSYRALPVFRSRSGAGPRLIKGEWEK